MGLGIFPTGAFGTFRHEIEYLMDMVSLGWASHFDVAQRVTCTDPIPKFWRGRSLPSAATLAPSLISSLAKGDDVCSI